MLESRLQKPRLLNKKLVERPRLMQLFLENLDKQVFLVCAPAGYGKSVAIQQWSKQQDLPTAWVNLDERLNNLASFLSHIVAALKRIGPKSFEKTLAFSRNLNGRSLTDVAEVFSKEIGEFGKPLQLVLDDYHAINSPEIHLFVQSILHRPPKLLRVILITRSDPPISMSRLRIYEELFELTGKDLSFTEQELEQYLLKHNPNVLDPELNKVLNEAGGWILGINLILSTHQLNPKRKVSLATGRNVEYLVGQLCKELSAEVFEALCLSTLLESFTAEILDTLFGEMDSIGISGETFIQEIIGMNLFLTKDELREGWYRFHQLFRELVRSQCKEPVEGLKETLLSVASKWLAERGYVDEALYYATEAQNWDLAVSHITENRIETFDRGQWWEVHSWIQKLPVDRIHKNPVLLLSLMWVNEYTWRLWEVPKLLIHFENIGRIDDHSPRDRAEYYLHLAHHYLFFQSDPTTALECLEKSINTFKDKGMLGATRELCIGLALHMTTGNENALDGLDSLEKKYPVQSPIYLRSLMTKVLIHLLSSNYDRAEWESNKMYFDVQGTSYRTFLAWSYYLAGNIDFQYGRESATMHFKSATSYEESLNNRVLIDTFAGLALSLALNKDEAAAWNVIGNLKRTALQLKDPYLNLAAESAEKRLHLICSNNVPSLGNPLPYHEVQAMEIFCLMDVPAITQIRIQVCIGSTGEIRHGLNEIHVLIKILKSAHNTYHNLDLYLLRALGYFRLGKHQKALNWLDRAFQWYMARKNIRPYIEIQKTVPQFFHWAPEAILPAELSRELPDQTNGKRGSGILNTESINRLTDREKEVARLVSFGMNNSEVAVQLDISEATVKSHLTKIFRKLGIHNRTTLARMTDHY